MHNSWKRLENEENNLVAPLTRCLTKLTRTAQKVFRRSIEQKFTEGLSVQHWMNLTIVPVGNGNYCLSFDNNDLYFHKLDMTNRCSPSEGLKQNDNNFPTFSTFCIEETPLKPSRMTIRSFLPSQEAENIIAWLAEMPGEEKVKEMTLYNAKCQTENCSALWSDEVAKKQDAKITNQNPSSKDINNK